jgi:hypothetical protein
LSSPGQAPHRLWFDTHTPRRLGPRQRTADRSPESPGAGPGSQASRALADPPLRIARRFFLQICQTGNVFQGQPNSGRDQRGRPTTCSITNRITTPTKSGTKNPPTGCAYVHTYSVPSDVFSPDP